MLLLTHKKVIPALYLYRKREGDFPVSCGSLAGGNRTKLLKTSFTCRGPTVFGTQGGSGVPGAIVGKARGLHP